jgi:hypothetical protein
MSREPSSWTIAGWLMRLCFSSVLGGHHRCAARRCGNMAHAKADRYCSLHGDVLLAEFGSGQRASEARRRLTWLGRGTQRRLHAWAMALAAHHGRDAFNLVADGYVPEGYPARAGIVQ